MINEIIVRGSEQTSYHTFNVTQSGNVINIHPGSYFQQGNKVFELLEVTSINLVADAVNKHYQLWITPENIVLLERTDQEMFDEVENGIDMLLYYSIPANTTDFDSLEINFIKVVKEDGNNS